jgi:hypothetical protein
VSLTRWCGVVVMTAAAAVVSADQTIVESTTRSIYASVTDGAGRPVLDMTAADFEVRENGSIRSIEVRPAALPLRVALLVSHQGSLTGRLLPAARALCAALDGHGEISVIAVMGDAETLSEFSDRAENCRNALDRLEAQQRLGSHSNPALVEAVLKAASTIRHDGHRSAIVVLRGGAERPTPLFGDRIRDAIRASGAVLYVASTPGAARQVMSPLGLAVSTIIDGASESGGRHLIMSTGNPAAATRQIASELSNSYEIRYAAGDVRPGAKISVSSNRSRLTILAPTRVTR